MNKKAVGIVLAGGPAPGINGVISAATIEAINRGHRVFGIHRGFERIMMGDLSCVEELRIADVSRIHSEGGSVLETSRANPRAKPEYMAQVVAGLKECGIGYLVTIGGDGTAATAAALVAESRGEIQICHVPKTIDNDLPLPEKYSTFGFQTAREVGTDITETLMKDAATTRRFYLVVAQGRKAGHLALGIGISSGATATLIPEEFPEPKIPVALLRDIIVGTMLKRIAMGRPHGVIILAEGLAEKIDPDELPELQNAARDLHGFLRYADFDFGGVVKRAVRARLAECGLGHLLVMDKNVGYELRCCPPNSFDREYTRILGYGVIDYLLQGGSEAMISRQRDNLVPIPFNEFIDRSTGMARVRYVDTKADLYRAAKKYMIRLTEEDLKNEEFLTWVEQTSSLKREDFQREFLTAARQARGYADAYNGFPLERKSS